MIRTDSVTSPSAFNKPNTLEPIGSFSYGQVSILDAV